MTIHVQNLGFSYKNEGVYQSFNANITKPGIYGLFGRNGSGKSTLLKLLAGLLTPTNGTIDVLGYTPRQRLPDFLSHIYILPEEFHLPDLKPIALGKTHANFYPQFSLDLFTEYLQTFEVPNNKRFSQMSLGQKKKSAIAFALATCTPILLMDEPTNGLDIVSREQFKDLMAMPEQAKRIVLISTHQAHDLERIINHILFIDGGKLLLSSAMKTLGHRLSMGVAENADNLPTDVVHQERIGEHIAWVSKNTTGSVSTLNIEMLYKALSLSRDEIIKAVNEKTQ
ncbi:MAG: ABC transporter ATP-binding protein [Gammaproteobacteria bacterium]|nr:ABC transporter ATP-binding protein [Gammaproteobacteria bacterium]